MIADAGRLSAKYLSMGAWRHGMSLNGAPNYLVRIGKATQAPSYLLRRFFEPRMHFFTDDIVMDLAAEAR